MELYEKLYHLLFNGITDVLPILESGGPDAAGQALQMLHALQSRAEEVYMDTAPTE
ncbi:MAG: hypothetical protein IJ055_10795 [Oscillospiraceae bacterium]|nr:hypothetical protein [Oscillospiraceae bacterium]MBQ8928743.1 hypothetical protein [Oscillospiraceae bacterium]